jgi:hypothetical protein
MPWILCNALSGKSPMIGRYMEARRDIQPGEVGAAPPASLVPGHLHRPAGRHRARQQRPADVHRLLEVGGLGWRMQEGMLALRKLTGHYCCSLCGWPLCGDRCRDTKTHQKECVLFQERGGRVQVSGFGKPNRMYDAVLPLRLLLLKLWDKKVYRLVCLLMDHKENQSPQQQRRQAQIAELIRITWGFAKDFSVNEVRLS